ncbi:MAG: ATP-binding protein [Desulfatibacillum sp.]|nr:ATP-binding protein [Desulfatibacillum sp.]
MLVKILSPKRRTGLNARDAGKMPEERHVWQTGIRIFPVDDHVVVEIRDNGPGMDALFTISLPVKGIPPCPFQMGPLLPVPWHPNQSLTFQGTCILSCKAS